MKSLIMTALFALMLAHILTGCSSDPAATPGACANSSLLGTWSFSASGLTDALTFNADCTGAGLHCKSTFTYPDVTASTGTVTVTQTSYDSTISGCTATNGAHTCSYSIVSTSLGVDCGSGAVTYTKQ